MFSKHFLTCNEKETKELGKRLAIVLPNGAVLALKGDLGAGKTTLTRGIAEGLHINEVVQSPTFNIMKLYLKGDRPLIHIDAYRLADINTDIGLDEYIGYETGITVIEWPDFIKELLPKETVSVSLLRLDDEKRDIVFECENESLLEEICNG